jgi:type 1 glutamine amidotransferase
MRRLSLSAATGALALLVAALLPARAGFPPLDKLPARPGLPDPLVMLDGARVTTPAQWRDKRRPELKALFQHYMYGQMPPAPAKVEAKLEREDRKALGGKATLREVTLTVGPPEAPKVHLLLVIPNARKDPAPAFVGMNFGGNHTVIDDPAVRLPTAWMYPGPGVKDNKATAAGRGRQVDVWALEQSVDRGYAVATFYSGDVDPDRKDVRGGLRPYLWPKGHKPGPHDTATLAAWAWGIHRAVDYLVTVGEIDAKRIAVVGHSRLGKTALLAAAFDERIALAIPHQAGCGGTSPSRGTVGESVKRINTSFPHWFNGAFKEFNDKVDRLPFDQNCLVALVAPRPVLFSNAVEDTWANPDGQFEVLQAADPVYRFLKAGGLEAKTRPPVNVLSAGTLGYYIRPGKHSMTRGDWKAFLDFADKHLKAPGSAAALPRKLLLVGQGPDGHPANTHEYVAGLRVLEHCLKKVPGVQVMTARADGAWKDGPELIDRADAVVLFLAEGARWMDVDAKRKAALARLAKRGGGVVVLHWAMGTRDAKHIPGCLALVGGCHGGPDRKYKVLETAATVADRAHPIMAGVDDFRAKDEFYYRLKFVEPAKGLAPLLRVAIDGRDETVAWAWQRPDGGRSFGFSGLHYHDNWRLLPYRRMVAQGALWALKLPVPKGGLPVEVNEAVLKAR